MKRLVLFILLALVSISMAQAAEDSMYGQLFGVLSYLGVILLSFLFALIVAIPFIDEVTARAGIAIANSPLSNRFAWAAEAALGLILVFFTISSQSPNAISGADALLYVISTICAMLPFVIFITIAFISNVYKRNLLHNVFSLVLWGIVASSISLLLNQTAESWFGFISGSAALLLILSAFFEEAFKGVGLSEFLLDKKLAPVLGMLYGFSIGIGFSMLENWLYFSYVTTPSVLGVSTWTQVLFYRSFFTTLAHGFFTAANAYLVCTMPNSRYRFIIGLGVAFLLHLLYNTLAKSSFVAAAPFMVLAMAFGFLYIAYSHMKGQTMTFHK